MALRIVFLDEYSMGGADLTHLRSLGEYTGYEMTDDELTVERCHRADVVISNKVALKEDVIGQLPDLKLICVAATGMNNVDLAAAAAAGILVANAMDYSTHSVAEQTLCSALALLKQLLYFDDFVKGGAYAAAGRLFDFGRPTHELYGKRWGIIGLGNIGRQVARLAEAFGCEVAYHSTSGKNHDAEYTEKSLEELLGWADVVSIHAPLSKQTYHLIDYPQLSLMKRGAIIVNMARGSIVNEEGLARALNEGLIAGAATDVYSREPIAKDNPLLRVEDKYKLVLTPHSAWATKEALQRLVDKVTENIERFIAGTL